MGFLVNTPSFSIRQRTSNQDDNHSRSRFRRSNSHRQSKVDRSLLDKRTIEFLVCEVRDRREEHFPMAKKNRGRSKKRLRNNQKRRHRSEFIESRVSRHEQHKHKHHRRTPYTDVPPKQMTVPNPKKSGTKSDDVSPKKKNPQDVSRSKKEKSVTMQEAFECVARPKFDFDIEDEDEEYYSCDENNEDHKNDQKVKKKDHQFGRFSRFAPSSSHSRSWAVPRSSRSRTSSTVANILGKLGRHRFASGDSVKSVECRDEISVSESRRSYESSTVGYDGVYSILGTEKEEEITEIAEKQGTSENEAAQKELNDILDSMSKTSDESLDPIFVSGMDLDISDKDQLDLLDDILTVASELHTIMDDRDQGVIDNADSDDRGDSSDIRDESSICEFGHDKFNGDEVSDVGVSNNVIVNVEDGDNGVSDIFGSNSSDYEACNVDDASKIRSTPPSTEPNLLCERNYYKRNELAWSRCAARNRERPINFPIPRERNHEIDVEEQKVSISNSYLFSFFSCGEIFVF